MPEHPRQMAGCDEIVCRRMITDRRVQVPPLSHPFGDPASAGTLKLYMSKG